MKWGKTMAEALTDEQIQAIKEAVMEHGKARKQNFGSEFNEADFLCGVMCAFFATGTQAKIPAWWIFYPMSGRSIFEDDKAETEDDNPELTDETRMERQHELLCDVTCEAYP
jgi:hypothetical protein